MFKGNWPLDVTTERSSALTSPLMHLIDPPRSQTLYSQQCSLPARPIDKAVTYKGICGFIRQLLTITFSFQQARYLALRNESRRDMNECFCSPHPCSYSHRWTYYTAGVISRNWHTALCWLSCRTPQRANNNHCISWTSLHKVLQVRSCVK